MINISDKSQCCGCNNCVNKCPKHCIKFIKDNEGYDYPNVDLEKCIDCGLCEKNCPLLNNNDVQKFKPLVYGMYNKNQKIRKHSTSGGVFYELARYTIEHGGIVFGASYDENLRVSHTYTDKLNEIRKFMGSKYVQSNIGNTFKQVEQFLKEGKIVLFSGTPCQIGALKLFLKKDYEKLLCCDFVCEGVPSNVFFDAYKAHFENKYKSKMVDFQFRNKKHGWLNFSCCMKFANGKKKYIFRNDCGLVDLIFSGLIVRPSCYKCQFKELNSGSDFKLADFWKVKQSKNTEYNYYGVSHVVVNSEKALTIFNNIKSNFEIFDSSYDELLLLNATMKNYEYDVEKRKKLFESIENKTSEQIYEIIESFNKITKIQKFKTRIKVFLSGIKYFNKR